MSYRLPENLHRRAAIGLPIVAALLLTGCGSEQTVGAPVSPATATPASTSAPVPTSVADPSAESAPTPSPEPAGTTIDVTFADGKVTGVDGRVSVPVGKPIVLRVTSDVAEQIHLHGYDLTADVPAGGTAEIPFTADIPGSFEVELENLGKQLFQLRVS